VKQFPYALFDPASVYNSGLAVEAARQEVAANKQIVADDTVLVVADTATVVAKEAVVSTKHGEVLTNAADVTVKASTATNAQIGAVAAMLSAIGAASLATSMALAASSVVQQDLSGVTSAPLHRSPNAIVAMCSMDLSKDSDGGAWPSRVDGQYLYETLNGAYIPHPNYNGIPSETVARALGGTVNSTNLVAAANNTTTGWAAGSGGVLSLGTNNRLRVTNGAGTPGFANWTVALTGGQVYVMYADLMQGSSTAAPYMRVSSDNGVTWNVVTITSTGSGVFVAPTTGNHLFQFGNSNANLGYYFEVGNFHLHQVTAFAPSGSFYPNATDGNFYRLLKNLLSWADDLTQAAFWLRNNLNTNANGSVTGAQADPLGGTAAVKFVPANTVNAAYLNAGNDSVLVPGQSYTFGFYAKAAGYNFVLLGGDAISGRLQGSVVYDLGTGTVFSQTIATGTITAVAGAPGWYFCTFTSTAAATTGVGCRPFWRPYVNGTTPATGDGASGVLLFRPQLEQGTVATAYESKAVPDMGQSQTFRGNTDRVPRMGEVIAEANRFVVYDMDSPGRPMWMVFQGGGANGSSALSWNAANPAMTLAYKDGWLVVGTNGNGTIVFDLAADTTYFGNNNAQANGPFSIADRNKARVLSSNPAQGFTVPTFVAAALAITTMADAPMRPEVNLPRPTLALSGNGVGAAVQVWRHDGTVLQPPCTSPNGAGYLAFDRYNRLWAASSQDNAWGAWLYSRDFQTRVFYSNTTYAGTGRPMMMDGTGSLTHVIPGGREVALKGNLSTFQRVLPNQMAVASAAISYVGTDYSTGYQWGNNLRTTFSDTDVGSVSAQELIAGETGPFTVNPLTGSDPDYTVTIVGGNIRITRVATNGASSFFTLDTNIVTAPKKAHVFEVLVNTSSVAVQGFVGATNGGAESLIGNSYPNGTAQVLRFTVYPSGNGNGRIRLMFTPARGASGASALVGDWMEIAHVSVRRAVADRSYRAQSPVVFGTLTKTQVANAAQLVFYGGFNAANYAQDPAWSADYEVGAGGWNGMAVAMCQPNACYGPHNAATFPEDLSNAAWVKATGVTISANATSAPNGGITSDKIVEGTGAAPAIYGWSLQNGASFNLPAGRTVMVEASVKAGGRTQVAVGVTVSAICTAIIVDLTTKTAVGAVNASPGNYSSALVSAVDEANGNVRVSVRITSTTGIGSVQPYFAPASGGTVVYAGDGASGVYLTNVQFNRGDTAFPYRPGLTAAYDEIAPIFDRRAAGGIGPYFQYGVDGTGAWAAECFDGTTTRRVSGPAYGAGSGQPTMVAPDLSVSGQLTMRAAGAQIGAATGNPLVSLSSRYNLILNSEDITAWPTKTQCTTPLVDKLLPSAVNSAHLVSISGGAVTVGATYTAAVDVKADGYGWAVVALEVNGTTYAKYVNLATGATGGNFVNAPASITVTDATGGWWRVVVSAATTAASTAQISVYAATADGVTTFAGDGVSAIRVRKAQVKMGTDYTYQRVGAVSTDFDFQGIATWGQRRDLGAAFPGVVANARVSGGAGMFDEAAAYIWQQERQMYRDSAQVTLPDTSTITDMTYDDATDRWRVAAATYDAEFAGMVRVSSSAPAAGSVTKVAGRSGIKLLARSTVNPGVDVAMPSLNLRKELLRRAEEAAARSRGVEMYDWVGGFSVAETSGNWFGTLGIGAILPLGATMIGAQISGANIPANTVVQATGNGGNTIYFSAALTGTSALSAVSFNDFILPVGMEARDVFAGAQGSATLKKEGTTADYQRLFDGFRERVRFTTGPGATAHVRVNARKMA
jgi:hypothetical protein